MTGRHCFDDDYLRFARSGPLHSSFPEDAQAEYETQESKILAKLRLRHLSGNFGPGPRTQDSPGGGGPPGDAGDHIELDRHGQPVDMANAGDSDDQNGRQRNDASDDPFDDGAGAPGQSPDDSRGSWNPIRQRYNKRKKRKKQATTPALVPTTADTDFGNAADPNAASAADPALATDHAVASAAAGRNPGDVGDGGGNEDGDGDGELLTNEDMFSQHPQRTNPFTRGTSQTTAAAAAAGADPRANQSLHSSNKCPP